MAEEARRRRRRKLIRNGIIVAVLAGVVVGSVYLIAGRSSNSNASSTSTTGPQSAAQAAANKAAVDAGCPQNPATRVNTLSWTSPPPMTIDTSKTYTATIKTTVGTMVMTLNPSLAPKAVNNFVFLAKQGFYHCVIFHRVIPQFVDQTGDPTGTGTGGPGYEFTEPGPPVASPQYPLGSVAMANSNSPATTDPTTNGSQFFIVTGPQGEALQPDYTLFGTVTSGMDVAQKINAQGTSQGTPKVTQRMLSVTIHES
jgi:cyclophilin family peptidyl-prolyl cis-trans isomerase